MPDSIDDLKLIEIENRLKALRDTLPLLEDAVFKALEHRNQIHEEIRQIEGEKQRLLESVL
jgi:hypothetical protein